MFCVTLNLWRLSYIVHLLKINLFDFICRHSKLEWSYKRLLTTPKTQHLQILVRDIGLVSAWEYTFICSVSVICFVLVTNKCHWECHEVTSILAFSLSNMIIKNHMYPFLIWWSNSFKCKIMLLYNCNALCPFRMYEKIVVAYNRSYCKP